MRLKPPDKPLKYPFFLSCFCLQKVVLLREAYCTGKPHPWVNIEGIEKCRYGVDKLTAEQYIELDTLATESLHNPQLTVEDFDKWVKMDKTGLPPSKLLTTTQRPGENEEEYEEMEINPTPTQRLPLVRPSLVTTTITKSSPSGVVTVTRSHLTGQDGIIDSTVTPKGPGSGSAVGPEKKG